MKIKPPIINYKKKKYLIIILGRNPLAFNPIKMRPQTRKRVSDLIPSGLKVDKVIGPFSSRDLTDPPTIIVEGIDLVKITEPSGLNLGGNGSDLIASDRLNQKLGLVISLQKVLVFYHEQVFPQLRHHRGCVVGPHEAWLFAAYFNLVPSLKRHRWIQQTRSGFGLNLELKKKKEQSTVSLSCDVSRWYQLRERGFYRELSGMRVVNIYIYIFGFWDYLFIYLLGD